MAELAMMQTAQTLLSAAKATYEDSQSTGSYEAWEPKVQLALSQAGDALAESRRSGDAESRVRALQLAIDCHVDLGDIFAANLAATDELAMIRRTGDKASEAKALQLLADLHAARGDGIGAIEALTEVLAMQKELGDQAGEAKALLSLAEVRLAMGKADQALSPASDACELYKTLGDSSGETAAARALSKAYVNQGEVEKAPGRAEALQALKDAGEAIDNEEIQALNSALEALNRSGAYNADDVKDLRDLLPLDDKKASIFREAPALVGILQVYGLAAPGSGQMTCMNEVGKTMTYIGFRVGGLGYGPRFRCRDATYRKQVPGKQDTLMALSALQVSDAADDWEAALQFHPGVLDGLLQSGTAYS